MNTLARGFEVSPHGLWQRLLARLLAHLDHGTLTIEDRQTTSFGTGGPHVRITVRSPRFYRRVVLGGTVGAGESYVDGDWDCDDLVGLVRMFIANRSALEQVDGAGAALSGLADFVGHLGRRNSMAGSRRNISAHYDLSNAFFETFLDSRMMYSSALFETSSALFETSSALFETSSAVFEPSSRSLETASEAKLKRLCEKLALHADDHLLEIGSGWGGLALYAASHYGCRVTTTTISKEQYDAVVEKVRAQGLERQVRVLQQDYRDLDGTYDKVVSVEMVEAVGHQYLDRYFAAIDRLLEPGGLCVLQAITIEDDRYRQAVGSVDFIKKHVFPGSFIPSVSALVQSAARQTETVLVNLEDLGADYAQTLNLWRARFEMNLPRIRELGFDERFIRMWRFYLVYCEGGFLERAISNVHLLFAKRGYRGQPWRVERA